MYMIAQGYAVLHVLPVIFKASSSDSQEMPASDMQAQTTHLQV